MAIVWLRRHDCIQEDDNIGEVSTLNPNRAQFARGREVKRDRLKNIARFDRGHLQIIGTSQTINIRNGAKAGRKK